MVFLIHYLVKTPLAPLHFDCLVSGPVHAKSIDQTREVLASDAKFKTRRPFDAEDIVIANIIPIPEPDTVNQIGGS